MVKSSKLIYFMLTMIVSFMVESVWAQDKAIMFQGLIKDPSGTLINVVSTTVNAKIMAPNGCVLREESFSAVGITNGFLTLPLLTGFQTGYDPSLGSQSMFNNSTSLFGLTCLNADGTINAPLTSYTPTTGDGRTLRLQFLNGADNVAVDFNMLSTPFAMNAETLNGRTDLAFLKTSSNITQSNVENTLARLTALDQIINSYTPGTSTFAADTTGNAATATSAGNVSGVLAIANGGTGATTVVGARTALLPNQASNAGRVLQTDGTNVSWVDAAGAGTITSVTAGSALSGGGATGSVSLALSNLSATSVYANLTGSAAAPTTTTIDQVLDSVSSTQGSILYRGSAGWVSLAPGVAGQFLQTQGPGNDPQWANTAGIIFAGTFLQDLGGGQLTTVVNQMKGAGLSVSSLTTGNFLRYNGTNFVNTAIVPADMPGLDLSQFTTGSLSPANGGTGVTTMSLGDILIGGGTGPVTTLAAGAAGNIAFGSGIGSWSSDNPNNIGLVDKTSAQTISGAKVVGAKITLANQTLMSLGDSGSKEVSIGAPATVSSTYPMIWPTAQAGTITILKNDGAGNLSWSLGEGLPATAGSPGAPAYAFAGNTNTGLYNPVANQIGFSVNAAEKVRVDATGNVGIGTTTPQSLLQIAGGLQFANDAVACVVAKSGTLRYNASKVYFCNGSSWQQLGAAGVGMTSLGAQGNVVQSFANGTAGTTPAFVSGSGIHTLNIPMASAAGVTAGLISKTDFDNFNAKLDPGLTFVGDMSGSPGATSVDNLKSKPLSIATLSNNELLKFDGTSWANALILVSDVPVLDASKIGSGTWSVSAGGTSTASLGSGNLLIGNGTGAVASRAGGTIGNVLYGASASSWASGTPNVAGVVDKSSVQTISGAKTISASFKMANQNLLSLGDGAANAVSFKAPATITSSYSMTLPAAQGPASTFLTNDGSGNLDWAIWPGGTVTSFTGTAPITVTLGTTTPNISIATAGPGTLGAISVTDWNSFNDRLSTVSTFSPDMTGTNTTTQVARIKGTALSFSSLSSGDFLEYNGTNWVNLASPFNSSYLSNDANLLKVSNMPANCAVPQVLTFSAPASAWVCSSIAGIDGSAITAGTISNSYLPASALYWVAATGGIDTSSGNVGIGASAPGAKMEVAGDVKGTDYYSTSDRRLKKNILPLENSLENINRLQGVRFDWIKDGKPEIGLIAQEVEKVYPDLVITDPVTGLKAVKYQALISPLIEAYREIHTRWTMARTKVLSLKSRNLELKQKLVQMSERVDKLERNATQR